MNVRIYRPSKNTMQSGRAKIRDWVLEYETTSARKPEFLMGWTESADTLNQVRIKFKTAEDAVLFAKKHGWDYTLTMPHERRVVPRNFGDNFKYTPVD